MVTKNNNSFWGRLFASIKKFFNIGTSKEAIAPKSLKISKIFVGTHDVGADSIVIVTKDRDHSLSGYFNMLTNFVPYFLGGDYRKMFSLPFLNIIITKKDDTWHNPHAMRDLCTKTITKHGGICKIKNDPYDVRTESGYSGLVCRLFGTENFTRDCRDEYEIDSYEDAIPSKYRRSS